MVLVVLVVLVAKHVGSEWLYRQRVAVAPVRSEADRLQCLLFIISGFYQSVVV